MKTAFDRRRRRSCRCSTRSTGVVCPTPRGRVLRLPVGEGAARPATYDGRRSIDTSADLAEYILEEAEVAVVPGEAFGTPGLPAPVLRPRRRRPGRGHHPAPEALRLRWRPSPSRSTVRTAAADEQGARARRTDAAEGPPAPALHRVDAARDAARARRARRHPAARLAGRASGRRSCRRPTRRAGSASSGSTTWPGRCCAPRTTYAGWCARPRRTTSRDGGRWLEIQVDPSGTRARFGGITAFTDLVLDAVARGLGRDRARHRRGHRGQPHPAPARRPHPGPARRAVRRPRGGRLRALQRRAARRHRGVRAGVRDRRAGRAAARAPRRRAARPGVRPAPASTSLHADRLGHGVRVGGGPRPARPARRRGHRARGLPGLQRRARRLLRPHLGAAADAARGRRHHRPRRRRPAAVRVAAGRAVRHHARGPRPRATRPWPSSPRCRSGRPARRTR